MAEQACLSQKHRRTTARQRQRVTTGPLHPPLARDGGKDSRSGWLVFGWEIIKIIEQDV